MPRDLIQAAVSQLHDFINFSNLVDADECCGIGLYMLWVTSKALRKRRTWQSLAWSSRRYPSGALVEKKKETSEIAMSHWIKCRETSTIFIFGSVSKALAKNLNIFNTHWKQWANEPTWISEHHAKTVLDKKFLLSFETEFCAGVFRTDLSSQIIVQH